MHIYLDKPPKNIFVICNPYSGERTSRNIYNVKLRPMLDRARYNITYSGSKMNHNNFKLILNRNFLEIDDYYTADDVLNNFQGDFETIYGYEWIFRSIFNNNNNNNCLFLSISLVIIGGDGSVINTINSLINHLAKENQTK